MKPLRLGAILMGIGALLVTASTSQASVSISFGIGGGDRCEQRPYYHHYEPYSRSCYTHYQEPIFFYSSPQVIYQSQSRRVYSTESAPYGFMHSNGIVRSPYSDFTVNIGGRSPGDVVYDANNGRAFRIP